MSLAVGTLIGMTSMGGAALMAPILILVVGMKPSVAVQTDLLYGAVTKIFGAAVHLRQGTVDKRLAFTLAAGSVPGGLAGSFLVMHVARSGMNLEVQLRGAIGALLVVVSLVLFTRLAGLWKRPQPRPARVPVPPWVTALWGFFVGLCVGLTSVGSGSMIAPFLMLFFPLPASRIVGTDVFHAAILVSVSGLIHSSTSQIQWAMLGTMLAGSIPGVLLGSYLVPFMPVKPLRFGLAALLLLTGLKLIQ